MSKNAEWINKEYCFFICGAPLAASLSKCKVSANRMQNLKTRFRKLCWGAAWLREAKSVQTECRTWKLVFESYAEVQPDFVKQRYNTKMPKSKFFRRLISHLESFPHPQIGIQPFIYGHSGAFSTHEKKWNRDIPFYLLPILKTYQAATFLPHPNAIAPHLFATEPKLWVANASRRIFCKSGCDKKEYPDSTFSLFKKMLANACKQMIFRLFFRFNNIEVRY